MSDPIKIKSNGKTVSFTEAILDQNNFGIDSLNSRYPDEVELYACALELINMDGDMLNFFSFPVMPSNIQENRGTTSNVKKTLGGIVVTNNSTFLPFDITISGNFGRKFRRVNYKDNVDYPRDKLDGGVASKTKELVDENGIKETITTSNIKEVVLNKSPFDNYKTGYGSIKVLEKIYKRSQTKDGFNRPLMLLFYNLSLNSNYLVEPINLSISQNRDQNMIWQYTLQLKAIAPVEYIIGKNSKQEKIKKITDYNSKFIRMNEKSSFINEMLKDLVNGMTPAQSILNKFENYKAWGAQSGHKLLKQLTDNPLENINIIKR